MRPLLLAAQTFSSGVNVERSWINTTHKITAGQTVECFSYTDGSRTTTTQGWFEMVKLW